MKFAALIAIAAARELAGKATNEDAAMEAYQNARAATKAALGEYRSKKAHARKEEGELKREIKETQDQEVVVANANKKAAGSRRAVFVAQQAASKAFEGYMDAMDEALHYTK